MKQERTNEPKKIEWNSYLATAYAEGFCEGESATQKEQLEAWAYLIKTGQCWKLQGWFGRTAMNLIKSEIIDRDGNILKTMEELEDENIQNN